MGEAFRVARSIGLSVIAAALLLSVAPGHARAATPFLGPLARPTCQPGDRTETGLDGQLTATERASGAATRPYNCNLAIVGEYAGQGAGHQLLWYGHCAYVTTEGYEAGQKGVPPLEHPGIQVLDVTHQRDPRYVTHLDDPASLYDWEDGSVNPRRALLGSAESWMGAGPQPAVSFYDLSDCEHPRLLSSVQIPDPELQAHAGNFAYDGKTYWIASFNKRRLYAIDLSDPRHPRELLDWDFPHGEAGGAQAHQICHRISLNQFAVDGHPPDTLLFCGVVGHLVHAGISARATDW